MIVTKESASLVASKGRGTAASAAGLEGDDAILAFKVGKVEGAADGEGVQAPAASGLTDEGVAGRDERELKEEGWAWRGRGLVGRVSGFGCVLIV